MKHFWQDERGTLLVTDWVFLATILVLAALPAMVDFKSKARPTIENEIRYEIPKGSGAHTGH